MKNKKYYYKFILKSYSFFLKNIQVKKKIPIKIMSKSLRKGPDIRDIGNKTIKYDGKFRIFTKIVSTNN